MAIGDVARCCWVLYFFIRDSSTSSFSCFIFVLLIVRLMVMARGNAMCVLRVDRPLVVLRLLPQIPRWLRRECDDEGVIPPLLRRAISERCGSSQKARVRSWLVGRSSSWSRLVKRCWNLLVYFLPDGVDRFALTHDILVPLLLDGIQLGSAKL